MYDIFSEVKIPTTRCSDYRGAITTSLGTINRQDKAAVVVVGVICKASLFYLEFYSRTMSTK